MISLSAKPAFAAYEWVYTVRSGDTLSQLVERELGMSWYNTDIEDQVRHLNPGINVDWILAGNSITLPEGHIRRAIRLRHEEEERNRQEQERRIREEEERRRREEEERRRQEEEDRRRQEEEDRRKQAEEEAARKKAAEEEERKKREAEENLKLQEEIALMLDESSLQDYTEEISNCSYKNQQEEKVTEMICIN